MPHYIIILHALHNLSFSFTITFTFNKHKTIVEIHYNFDNNIYPWSDWVGIHILAHGLWKLWTLFQKEKNNIMK